MPPKLFIPPHSPNRRTHASKLALEKEVESLKSALEEESFSRALDLSGWEEEKRLLVLSGEEEKNRLEVLIEELKVDKGSAQMGQQSMLLEKEWVVARQREESEASAKKIEEMRAELQSARSEKQVLVGEKEMLVLGWEEDRVKWEAEKQVMKEAAATMEAERREEAAASALKVDALEKEKKKLRLEVDKASKLTAELVSSRSFVDRLVFSTRLWSDTDSPCFGSRTLPARQRR